MVKTDPSAVQYVARLNDFWYEFNRVGHNYNQVVRQVNAHFSKRTIPTQLATLTAYTRQLKALSQQIVALSQELRELWLPE